MTTLTERRWSDRRSRRSEFHLPERRSGFDRRLPTLLAWYRDRPLLIATVLASVLALSGLDLILTTEILNRGGAEANPVMAALFDAGPGVATAVKMLLTAAVAATIWAMRRYRLILQVSLVALAAYSLLITYQLAILTTS